MDSFTFELISNISFNCYPNNSFGYFTKFLHEQTYLKGEWEVGCYFRNIIPFFVLKSYRGKVYFRR